MVAQSAPAVVEHGSCLAVALHVGECGVVEPPCVAQSCEFFVVRPLLPVEPPEVHALFLHRAQYLAVPSFHETLVGSQPWNVLLLGGVHAHPFGKVAVMCVVGVYAVGRMQIECHVEIVAFHPFQEFCVVGEESFVPCVSAPCSLAGFGVMPVHVDYEHVEGESVVLHVVHEAAQFVVAVRPVARPPVAEGVAWWQRHLASKRGVVLQGFLVVVSVGEEIPVLRIALIGTFLHPCPVGVVEGVVL